jgi:hypothetical protein
VTVVLTSGFGTTHVARAGVGATATAATPVASATTQLAVAAAGATVCGGPEVAPVASATAHCATDGAGVTLTPPVVTLGWRAIHDATADPATTLPGTSTVGSFAIH